MKTSKWIVIAVAAAVTIGGLTIVKAKADNNAGIAHFGNGRFLARAKARLGLTDSQVSQIKIILSANKEKLAGLLTSCHEERQQLRKIIQTPGATEAQVRAASAKVAAVSTDLAVERAVLYSQISPILTADQIEKINEFQDKVDDFVDGAIAGFTKRLAE